MIDFKGVDKEFLKVQAKADIFLQEFIRDSESRTTNKILSKGKLFNLRPFEVQRSGFELGKEIKKSPKNTKYTYLYCIDDNGFVTMIEGYGQTKSIVNREFYFYGKDELKSVYFNSAGSIRNITCSIIVDGQHVSDINFGKFGGSTSEYEYEGEQLRSILVRQQELDALDYSTYRVLFEYSDSSLFRVVNVFPNGHQEQRYP